MRATAYVLGFVLFWFQISCSTNVGNRTFEVCDVLKNPWRYQGQVVTVHGLVMETFHGAYLWDWQDSRATCNEVDKQNKHWPTDIYMEWDDSTDSIIEREVRGLRSTVLDQEKLGHIYGYTANVTGKIETRFWTRIEHQGQNGGYKGNGYGVDGACAAKLNVVKISAGHLVPEQEILLKYPRKIR